MQYLSVVVYRHERNKLRWRFSCSPTYRFFPCETRKVLASARTSFYDSVNESSHRSPCHAHGTEKVTRKTRRLATRRLDEKATNWDRSLKGHTLEVSCRRCAAHPRDRPSWESHHCKCSRIWHGFWWNKPDWRYCYLALALRFLCVSHVLALGVWGSWVRVVVVLGVFLLRLILVWTSSTLTYTIWALFLPYEMLSPHPL